MAAGRTTTSMAAAALVALLVVAAAATADAFAMCNLDESAVEPCQSYCANGSTDDRPTLACCAAMWRANFQCLCDHMSTLRLFAMSNGISVDRAMEIPAKCKIPNAPTKCGNL